MHLPTSYLMIAASLLKKYLAAKERQSNNFTNRPKTHTNTFLPMEKNLCRKLFCFGWRWRGKYETISWHKKYISLSGSLAIRRFGNSGSRSNTIIFPNPASWWIARVYDVGIGMTDWVPRFYLSPLGTVSGIIHFEKGSIKGMPTIYCEKALNVQMSGYGHR